MGLKVNPISMFKMPVNGISPLERGVSSRGVQKAGGVTGGNPFAGFEPTGINGELTPNLGATGSSYTNGLGHSTHNKLNFFA